ncbi:hypothetical protein AMTRI_Chr03g54770 [Amborella trichopoda]
MLRARNLRRPILVVGNHVSPLNSSSFFTDFGMDSGIKKKPSSTYPTVQETKEAQQKFSNAKCISSAQFFFFSSLNVNFGCMFYLEARLEQDYYVKGSQKKYLILLWHLHFEGFLLIFNLFCYSFPIILAFD